MKNDPKPWMALDNAAKIYPAAMRKDWMAMFRLSADLTEPVDNAVLEQALRCTLPRFPGFSVHLRRGLFWFYLEHSDDMPDIQSDVANPCLRINEHENKRFMFRLRCYNNRIAVEVFHVLTDGNGGLRFLKTLVAEYLRIKYGAKIPRNSEILDCSEKPKPEETEDSFHKYAGSETHSRRESDAYYIRGYEEPSDVIHITTGIIPVNDVLERARAKGVTLTEYLASVLILSVDTFQRRKVKKGFCLRPVKICIPVNLRAFFPSITLRNFSLYINLGIEPRLGVFTFDEVLKLVHNTMGIEATAKNLQAHFAANVRAEKNHALRLTPLFIKNVVMKMAFIRKGDRKTSTTLTNLGRVTLPPEMAKYVTRMDLILGPLSRNRVVSASLSYGDMLYFTFTRTITDSSVEREFFRQLVKLGIHVKVESNNQWY